MDKNLAYKLGLMYAKGYVFALGLNLAKDANQWITVHPNGKENKGTPVLVDVETKEVKAGMGGKFNGRHISAATKNEEVGAQAKIDRARAIANGWKPKAPTSHGKKGEVKTKVKQIRALGGRQLTASEQSIVNSNKKAKMGEDLRSQIKTLQNNGIFYAYSKNVKESTQKEILELFNELYDRFKGLKTIIETYGGRYAENNAFFKGGLTRRFIGIKWRPKKDTLGNCAMSSIYLNPGLDYIDNKDQAKGYTAASSKKYAKARTMIHEFGHATLHAMVTKRMYEEKYEEKLGLLPVRAFLRARSDIMDDVRSYFTNKLGKSIDEINQAYCSIYGRYRGDGEEFFAEAFVDAFCGKRSELGQCMEDFLKEEGVIEC